MMKYPKEGEEREYEGVGRGQCVSSISIEYEREGERGGGGGEEGEFFPFWFPEHQATNTTSTPAVISSNIDLCLFECSGPIPTRGRGIEQRSKRLEFGGDRMESKIRRRRRGHFYDNIKCWEIPFRSNFLPL